MLSSSSCPIPPDPLGIACEFFIRSSRQAEDLCDAGLEDGVCCAEDAWVRKRILPQTPYRATVVSLLRRRLELGLKACLYASTEELQQLLTLNLPLTSLECEITCEKGVEALKHFSGSLTSLTVDFEPKGKVAPGTLGEVVKSMPELTSIHIKADRASEVFPEVALALQSPGLQKVELSVDRQRDNKTVAVALLDCPPLKELKVLDMHSGSGLGIDICKVDAAYAEAMERHGATLEVFSLEHVPFGSAAMEALCRRAGPAMTMTELSLDRIPIRSESLEALGQLRSLSKLEMISVADVSDESLSKPFAKLSYLRQLKLFSLKKLTGSCFAAAVLPRINSLEIHDCGAMNDDGLSHLGQLTSLESINISDVNKVTGDFMEAWRLLLNLRSVEFDSMENLSGEPLRNLRHCSALQELDVSGCSNVTAAYLTDFGSTPLKSISHSYNSEDDGAVFNHLRELPHLTSLSIRVDEVSNFTLGDVSRMSELTPQLRELSLDEFGHPGDFDALDGARLRNLGDVTLFAQDSCSPCSFAGLAALPALYKLSVTWNSLQDIHLAPLGNAARLLSLELNDMKIDGSFFEAFPADHQLKKLECYECKKLTDISGCAKLKHLSILTISGCTKLTCEAFKQGRDGGFPSLGDLELHEFCPTESALDDVACLPSLRKLQLGAPPKKNWWKRVTSGVYDSLTKLTNLRELELSFAKKGADELVQYIIPLKELRSLDLSDTKDLGSTHVRKLCAALPHLQVLNVYGTAVGKASGLCEELGVEVNTYEDSSEEDDDDFTSTDESDDDSDDDSDEETDWETEDDDDDEY